MAQDYGTNEFIGDGTGLIKEVRVLRIPAVTGPAAGLVVTEAHGLAAGFTVIDVWVVATILADIVVKRGAGADTVALPTLLVDATNIEWGEVGDFSGHVGTIYLKYLPA